MVHYGPALMPEDPVRMARGPAIALLCVGALNGAFGLVIFAGRLTRVAEGGRLVGPEPGSESWTAAGSWRGEAIFLLWTLIAPVIIAGAVQMLRSRSWGFARVAAVLAMMPWTSGACIFGFPFGIWALVVLNRPAVKGAFGRRGSLDPGIHPGQWPPGQGRPL